MLCFVTYRARTNLFALSSNGIVIDSGEVITLGDSICVADDRWSVPPEVPAACRTTNTKSPHRTLHCSCKRPAPSRGIIKTPHTQRQISLFERVVGTRATSSSTLFMLHRLSLLAYLPIRTPYTRDNMSNCNARPPERSHSAAS